MWVLIVAIVYARNEEEAVLNGISVFKVLYGDIYESALFDCVELLDIKAWGLKFEDPCHAFPATSSTGKEILTIAVEDTEFRNNEIALTPRIFDCLGNPVEGLKQLTAALIRDPSLNRLAVWIVPAKAHF